ncbi:hypothetical protein [Mycolicibacterium rhodesiae]|nr:hypothetical protein [Mycolicibacterium rhodesiae]
MTSTDIATTNAHNVVMTAANTNDSSVPGQPCCNTVLGAKEPWVTPIALQRWESDGGAVH